MSSLIRRSKALAACGIAAGFFTASTLAYAQQQDPNAAPDLPPQQQQQSAPEGPTGWPQAGANSPASGNSSANPYGQAPLPPQTQQQQTPQQPPYSQQQPYGGGIYNRQQQAPPPVPSQIDVPAGTYVTVRLNSRLASDRNHPGDAFTASLVEPVVVNGVVIAEPGQTITGVVQEAQKIDGAGRLAVSLTDLPLVDGQRLPIQTQLIARKGDRFRGNDAGIVGGSTIAGAAIGSAIGWGTGAAIGAGAGALVSLGAVLTHGHASVLYPEEVLTFRLQQPITVVTTTAPQAFRYVQPGEYSVSQQGPGPSLRTGYQAPPPPPPAYYAYGYPGYGYPYWYGPSVGFYFGGGPYYRGGYWGRGYYGGHYYGGGFHRR